MVVSNAAPEDALNVGNGIRVEIPLPGRVPAVGPLAGV